MSIKLLTVKENLQRNQPTVSPMLEASYQLFPNSIVLGASDPSRFLMSSIRNERKQKVAKTRTNRRSVKIKTAFRSGLRNWTVKWNLFLAQDIDHRGGSDSDVKQNPNDYVTVLEKLDKNPHGIQRSFAWMAGNFTPFSPKTDFFWHKIFYSSIMSSFTSVFSAKDQKLNNLQNIKFLPDGLSLKSPQRPLNCVLGLAAMWLSSSVRNHCSPMFHEKRNVPYSR